MASSSSPQLGGGPGFGAGSAQVASPLKPAITRTMLIVFVIGDVLGAGIYALVGEVGGEVGGAIWTAFLLALVLAVFTAGAYAELVTKYPQAAGAALYVHRAFRKPFFTFMVAFAVMCSGITSAATLATAFGGDYLSEFVDLPKLLVGFVFITVVALVNFRGISESVKLNLGLTAIELSGLLLVVAIGLAFLLDGGGEPSRAFEFKDGQAVPLAILGGASLAFFALIGFEDSVNVAEETKEPSKNYPRALFGGLAVAGVVYLMVTIIASMVVPTGTLTDSDGPLLEVVDQGPLGVPTKVFAAIALFALTNGALINMIMASRLVYGMAAQGIVPPTLGRVHAERQTPWVAIIFTTVLAFVLIAVGDLESLAKTTVLLLLTVFVCVNVSVLILRRDPVDHDHYRTPTVVPILGALICLVLIVQKIVDDASQLLLAGGLLVLGAVLYLIARATAGPAEAIDPASLAD
ncbi:MAG: amino acid permease [Solirubrobacterales bacterium]|nr:amino acid permease [Solirubrobacterales bacterium]